MNRSRVVYTRRWLRWLLVGVTLLVVMSGGIGLYLVFQLRTLDLGTTVEDTLDHAAIERLINAKLPSSTTNLHSYYSGFQDYYALVRFDIDSDDLPQFLASTQFTQTLTTNSQPFAPSQSDPAWWQPDHAQQFRWGTWKHDNEFATLLIDTTNPKRYTVYWSGFDT